MRFPRILIAAFALSLSLMPASLLAQQSKDQPAEPAADDPGPMHQRLGELAGTWEVAIQYKLGDKVHNGDATCEAKLILDGRFLQQDYHSLFQGKPFHVMQILGFDNQKKKFVELMMDTMGTGILHNEGDISADGKVITNEGESRDPTTKKPFKLRTVYTFADHDHFTLEWYEVKDGDKAEKTVTLRHSRKKAG